MLPQETNVSMIVFVNFRLANAKSPHEYENTYFL